MPDKKIDLNEKAFGGFQCVNFATDEECEYSNKQIYSIFSFFLVQYHTCYLWWAYSVRTIDIYQHKTRFHVYTKIPFTKTEPVHILLEQFIVFLLLFIRCYSFLVSIADKRIASTLIHLNEALLLCDLFFSFFFGKQRWTTIYENSIKIPFIVFLENAKKISKEDLKMDLCSTISEPH